MGIKQHIKRLLKFFFYLTANRNKGLRQELLFWEKQLKNGEFQKSERFRSDIPLPDPFHDFITHLLDIKLQGNTQVDVLDVGAGPVTVISPYYTRKYNLNVTAIDTIAAEYVQLLRKYNVSPPITTQKCDAENILDKFNRNSFDMVYAQNSIDHTSDPFIAIKSMIKVLKPGGVLGLMHIKDEAVREAYRGLHQWNFTKFDDSFYVTGRNSSINITYEVQDMIELTTKTTVMDGIEWVLVSGIKKL